MSEKPVRLTRHLQMRLHTRRIPAVLPREIYETAKWRYLDMDTSSTVAVKEIVYRSKTREMAVAYREDANEVLLLTIHHLRPTQRQQNVARGRWVPI